MDTNTKIEEAARDYAAAKFPNEFPGQSMINPIAEQNFKDGAEWQAKAETDGLSFEDYCALIGSGPHNEPAFTIYKTLKHHGYTIIKK